MRIVDGRVRTAAVLDDAITSPKLDEPLIQYAEVEISSLELLDMFTTPKTLVAAPGANKVLEFISLLLAYDYGTTPYTIGAAGSYRPRYHGDSQNLGESISPTGFIDQASDQVRMGQAMQDFDTPLVDTLIELVQTAASPTLGDGVIHAKVAYKVHTTGF